jgi:hypothetical protein
MGTSKPSDGPSGTSPLVPSFLEPLPDLTPDDLEPAAPVELPVVPPLENPSAPPSEGAPPSTEPQAPKQPATTPEPEPVEVPRGDRYSPIRKRFTAITRGTGTSTAKIRRATSQYVRKGLGGASRAASRMAVSARTAGRMVGFIQTVQERGFSEAVKEFGLGDITGKAPQEVAPLLAEAFLEPGGGIDEGISNRAWVETVVEALEKDITDIKNITGETMIVLLENYVTRTIELRLQQDVAAKQLRIARDPARAQEVRDELHQIIRGEVRRAVRPVLKATARVQRNKLSSVGLRIYRQAFAYLSGEE